LASLLKIALKRLGSASENQQGSFALSPMAFPAEFGKKISMLVYKLGWTLGLDGFLLKPNMP